MKKEILSLERYTVKEIEQILSPVNRWATGERIGHDPDTDKHEDKNALVQNWIDSGAVKRFSENHEIKRPSDFVLGIKILFARIANLLRQ